MTQYAVRANGLGKRYTLSENVFTRHTLYDALSGLLSRRAAHEQQTLWALRGVSFEIQSGDVVGVIGRNGAGKSTLLKILSRITAPTEGRAELRGRLASLLEVGTGFHPELTGRENIYLNGAILGMRRAELARQFDAIVQFAEVEAFVDTPVKRYSSGMYVRLAFSVAAHLDPDILVIDEVLAVGDARFQKRCLGKMRDIAGEGRTVLFVSHNMHAVQRLCTRTLWLAAGGVKSDGPTSEIVGEYLREGTQNLHERRWSEPDTAPGNEHVALAAIGAQPLNGASATITIATGVRLTIEYWNRIEGAALSLSLHIYTSDDTLVLNAVPLTDEKWFGQPLPRGRFRCTCDFPPDLLNSETYRVELLVVRDQREVIFRDDAVIGFEVQESFEDGGAWHERFPGVVRPRLAWKTHFVDECVENTEEA